MGTHPIFESDFDCLTESLRIIQDGQRAKNTKDLLQVGEQAPPSRSPNTKLVRLPCTLKVSVVTIENNLVMVVKQNPSSTRRPKQPKRLCSVSNVPSLRRRSFWSS